ncbi:hypothetical protein CKO51_27120 [Rhodopirellula sp. SM50]|nr:hypothetical protein CKO51_27120 [Rhodopirellula sp. SM50]
MRESHERLAEYFEIQRLVDQNRVAPTYFGDHGHATDEREALRGFVRRGLQCKPLDSFDWSSAYLPLLVCAVEVGYDYQGNGTDFWPKLSENLCHTFSVDDRVRLSTWFAKTSARFGGVTPGDSDWEKAFCHIAWPITHAVAAKDIRRPFADCLRRFRRDVTNEALKDETIVSDLAKISTPVGSRRFRTWMDRPAVVAGIVRDLLGGMPLDVAGLFSKSFRDRLIDDLRNEPEIRRAVRQVEAGRKTKPRNLEEKSEATKAVEVRFGEFFLRQDENGGFEFCGEMPELPKSVQRSLKPIRGRWKVRPWGHPGANPIPSDCLRSTRGHFLVSFSYVARTDAETTFFTGLEELSLDDDAKGWLESVRFPVAEMLAFPSMDPSDDTSHCIGSRTPHHGKIWVLARRGVIQSRRSEEDDSHCRHVGDVDGGEIYEFEADNAEVRQWLGWPPASVASEKAEASFSWLRPSPVSIDSKNQPVYTTDDEIGVSVIGDDPVQVVLRRGQTELARELVSSVATVSIESKGSYELVVLRGDQELESFSFVIIDEKGDGFIEPDPETPWHAIASHVDAGETNLSRKDLFNRRLNLDIIGDRGIENLSARLTVSPGDASVTVRLDRIPTRLAANHPVWDELSRQLPTAILKSPCDLSLNVEIEGLSHDTWLLEAELQELWWDDDENDMPIAVSDDGPFEVRRYCVINGTCIDEPTEGDPFISIALDRDGNELHFDARVGVVGDSRLQRQLSPPKRFLRQMDDVGDNLGLRSITQRYLQLSSATSSSLTAEFNRVGAAQSIRAWILHSVCGPNWIHKQRELSKIESANPIAIWWECQMEFASLILPELEDGETRALPDKLEAGFFDKFSIALPDLWWDCHETTPSFSETDSINSVLHEMLSDNDLYIDEDYLPKSISRATELLCGGELAELLIPATAGDNLMKWPIAERTITELAEMLFAWVRETLPRGRGRQTWSEEELCDYLNLLLYPERLRQRPWQSVLEKLLQDRSVARSGAFIAWRVGQAARMQMFCESRRGGN